MPTEQTPTPRPKRATTKTAGKASAASTPATTTATSKPAAARPAASGPAASNAAAPKPAAAKPAEPKAAAPKPAAKPVIKSGATGKTAKARATARPSDSAAPMIDPEYRRALIAEEAYLRAERRNFAPGYEVEDWLNAESEIDTRLTLGAVPPIK